MNVKFVLSLLRDFHGLAGDTRASRGFMEAGMHSLYLQSVHFKEVPGVPEWIKISGVVQNIEVIEKPVRKKAGGCRCFVTTPGELEALRQLQESAKKMEKLLEYLPKPQGQGKRALARESADTRASPEEYTEVLVDSANCEKPGSLWVVHPLRNMPRRPVRTFKGVVIIGTPVYLEDVRAMCSMGFKAAVLVNAPLQFSLSDAPATFCIICVEGLSTAELEAMESLPPGAAVKIYSYRPQRHSEPLSMRVVMALTACIVMIIGILLYNEWERRRRQARYKQHIVPKSKLSVLSLAMYRKGLTKVDMASCVICLEAFTPVSLCRVLPCEHIFHPACIDPWLLMRSTRCPYCQVSVLTSSART